VARHPSIFPVTGTDTVIRDRPKHRGISHNKISSMLRFSVKTRVQQFLRPLPPPPLRTLTFTRRDAMADGAVRLQAIWFSKSGQWEHTPHLPYEIDAPYAAKTLPTSLILITWNVDFAQNNASPRLTAALDYLQFHAFPEYNGGQPPPCIILLQEIRYDAFDALLAHPWVRAWFMVVPAARRRAGRRARDTGRRRSWRGARRWRGRRACPSRRATCAATRS
jgi:hypothetical protein